MPPTSIEQRLVTLHAHYTSRVNAALAAGRMDLVQDLADDCRDEALDLILAAEGEMPTAAEVEILELGGLPQWPPHRPGPRRRRFWRHITDR